MQHYLPSSYLLQNRYLVTRMIGQGGFGITYEAIDQTLDKKVCIKELFVSGQNTRGANFKVLTQNIGDFSFDDFVKRFLDEARQLARFEHPNIVRVRDVFKANETAYMVMSFVEGQTLKQRIIGSGAMSTETAMPIFYQLLDAVETVHKAGMLHRDIKPDNILLTTGSFVVLIDFGSARDFTEGKTMTQTAMLTPGYAPIEQYSSKKQRGAYTDIYALGATLYFMLTGKKPFEATDRYAEEMPAPHQINKNIGTQISSAVMLALEMKAEDRFQSVGEFRMALQQMISQKKKQEQKTGLNNVESNKIISLGTLLKSWIYTNIFGSIAIIIIISIVDASLPPNLGQFIIIFLVLFVCGLLGNLAHFLYVNNIRKKFELNKFWKKTKLILPIPYLFILFLVGVIVQESGIFFSTFGVFFIHYLIGFITWKYFILRNNA